MRSALDVPCTPCGVSAGRYCDGPEPCAERVRAAAEADAQADAVRAIQRETVERCAEWLRQRASAVPGYSLPGGADYLNGQESALISAADELSVEVLPSGGPACG